MKRGLAPLVAGLLIWLSPLAIADVIGAGSSFVYPLMARWAQSYQQSTGKQINYQSIGTGGGLSQLRQKTVDFAAVDIPQNDAALAKYQWIQFPLAIGGLVVAIHVPGIGNNQLRLNGLVLADIFLGKITRWNDPAIHALNPELKLPSMNITVIHRADGSGTTYNFTQYLAAVSPSWANQVGSATEVNWPAGIGGKGNNGVAMFTERVPGSISYMEYSFAQLTKLNTVQLQNQAGNYLIPNTITFKAAADTARWLPEHHFQQLLINQPGANSWPIVATTFMLLPKANKSATQQKILDFVYYGWTHERAAIIALDYVPLPDPLVQTIKQYWLKQLSYKTPDNTP